MMRYSFVIGEFYVPKLCVKFKMLPCLESVENYVCCNIKSNRPKFHVLHTYDTSTRTNENQRMEDDLKPHINSFIDVLICI